MLFLRPLKGLSKEIKKENGAVQREIANYLNILTDVPNAVNEKLTDIKFKAHCHSHIYAVVSGWFAEFLVAWLSSSLLWKELSAHNLKTAI